MRSGGAGRATVGICPGREVLKDVFRLCWKGSVERCVPIVLEGRCLKMCSNCVGRAVLKGVFRLC